MESLKDFDLAKALLFVSPGAAFAIFRSFAMRGYFPKLSKDDLGALAISSAVFSLCFRLIGVDVLSADILNRRPAQFWVFILLLLPAIIGFSVGLVEANDYVGKVFRRFGFRFPSPEANAWETMFRELPSDSLLMVRLADETWVFGRWAKGSSSSQLTDARDLFLSETGSLSEEGLYEPFAPQRGVYFSVGEIKRIEVVRHPMPNLGSK